MAKDDNSGVSLGASRRKEASSWKKLSCEMLHHPLHRVKGKPPLPVGSSCIHQRKTNSTTINNMPKTIWSDQNMRQKVDTNMLKGRLGLWFLPDCDYSLYKELCGVTFFFIYHAVSLGERFFSFILRTVCYFFFNLNKDISWISLSVCCIWVRSLSRGSNHGNTRVKKKRENSLQDENGTLWIWSHFTYYGLTSRYEIQ